MAAQARRYCSHQNCSHGWFACRHKGRGSGRARGGRLNAAAPKTARSPGTLTQLADFDPWFEYIGFQCARTGDEGGLPVAQGLPYRTLLDSRTNHSIFCETRHCAILYCTIRIARPILTCYCREREQGIKPKAIDQVAPVLRLQVPQEQSRAHGNQPSIHLQKFIPGLSWDSRSRSHVSTSIPRKKNIKKSVQRVT